MVKVNVQLQVKKKLYCKCIEAKKKKTSYCNVDIKLRLVISHEMWTAANLQLSFLIHEDIKKAKKNMVFGPICEQYTQT